MWVVGVKDALTGKLAMFPDGQYKLSADQVLLVVGKQVGILLFSWAAVRLKIAAKPDEVSWLQIYGVGWLAAIGFTMSLFITNLAFTDPDQVQMAKIGILAASLLAGTVGFVILKFSLRGKPALDESAG